MKLPRINKNILFMIGTITILAALAIYYTVPVWGPEGFASGPEKVFYMVYADWCPHCQSVKPAMQQLRDDVAGGKVLQGKNIGIELIDGESGSPVLGELPKVKGFPTFFFKNGSSVQEYSGPRETSEIVKFLSGN
jgi:thiol-disulfide isomerase/thioredoxin